MHASGRPALKLPRHDSDSIHCMQLPAYGDRERAPERPQRRPPRAARGRTRPRAFAARTRPAAQRPGSGSRRRSRSGHPPRRLRWLPTSPTPRRPRCRPAALAPLRDTLEAGWDRVLDGRDAIAERLDGIDRARLWTWASVPIAALAVVAGLALIQGGSPTAPPPAPDAARPQGPGRRTRSTCAAPATRWPCRRGGSGPTRPMAPPSAARSRDGLATRPCGSRRTRASASTRFEQRSLSQLGEIAENPRVVDRVEGPTIESTITELRADAPVADGVTAPVRVTLRGAGDYRFYFSTVEQPGAAPQLGADIETMHASLRPDVDGGRRRRRPRGGRRP